MVYHINFVYKHFEQALRLKFENNKTTTGDYQQTSKQQFEQANWLFLWNSLNMSLEITNSGEFNIEECMFLHASSLQPFICCARRKRLYPPSEHKLCQSTEQAAATGNLWTHFPQQSTNQFEDAIFDARYCQCNSSNFNLFHQRQNKNG